MATLGKRTSVKLVGGQLIARQTGDSNELMRRKISEVKRRAIDMRQPFEAFVGMWFTQERQVFRSQGPGWPQLTDEYRRWKERHYPGKTILMREDRLYESLTRRTSDTHIRITPRTMQLGTNVPYSPLLQAKRPHVVILPKTFAALSRMCVEYMVSPLGARR